MKRIFALVLVLLFVAGVSTLSFAGKDKKSDRIVARIVSVDAAGKTIVVKEEKTGESRTIKVSAKAVSQIKVGDRVRIKLKPGTDESMGVRVLKDHSKDEAAIPAEPKVEPAVPAAATK